MGGSECATCWFGYRWRWHSVRFIHAPMRRRPVPPLLVMGRKAPSDGPSFTSSVGIGTSSPASTLDIKASTNGSNGGIRLEGFTTPSDISYWAEDQFVMKYGGVYRNAISSNGVSYFNGGNVGIGTSSPASTLDIKASTNGSNGGIRLEGFTTPSDISYWAEDQFVMKYGGVYRNAISSNGVSFFDGGNVGIGTTTPVQVLDVAGTIRQSGCTTAGTLAVNGSGDIICSSDARLKNVLGPYRPGLDVLAQIKPMLFTYKATAKDPKESFVHAGFIAQNVRAAIPQASALQRDGYYSLDTTAILATSVNAINELKSQLAAKDEQINLLNARLNRLERHERFRIASW